MFLHSSAKLHHYPSACSDCLCRILIRRFEKVVYNFAGLSSRMPEAITELNPCFEVAPFVARRDEVADSARGEANMANYSERFESIARDPRYGHFVRIPRRIILCMDYFHVSGDRIATRRILTAYYLFIGVVDNAIDSGEAGAAQGVFACLASPACATHTLKSDVAFMTETLKNYFDDGENRAAIIAALHELYERVLAERSAISIDAYLENRRDVGRLTAEVSYLLIRPVLEHDENLLRCFMREVGAVGCLVDSIIDLDTDGRLGLLGFKPTLLARAKLIIRTLHEGMRMIYRHPALWFLFMQAIGDNINDRFIDRSQQIAGEVVSEIKNEVVSAA